MSDISERKRGKPGNPANEVALRRSVQAKFAQATVVGQGIRPASSPRIPDAIAERFVASIGPETETLPPSERFPLKRRLLTLVTDYPWADQLYGRRAGTMSIRRVRFPWPIGHSEAIVKSPQLRIASECPTPILPNPCKRESVKNSGVSGG
jgi:hypothetical protein